MRSTRSSRSSISRSISSGWSCRQGDRYVCRMPECVSSSNSREPAVGIQSWRCRRQWGRCRSRSDTKQSLWCRSMRCVSSWTIKVFQALNRLLREFQVQPDPAGVDVASAPFGLHPLDAPAGPPGGPESPPISPSAAARVFRGDVPDTSVVTPAPRAGRVRSHCECAVRAWVRFRSTTRRGLLRSTTGSR